MKKLIRIFKGNEISEKKEIKFDKVNSIENNYDSFATLVIDFVSDLLSYFLFVGVDN